MAKHRVTVTEVITHSGTIDVDAESEEEAERSVAEGGYRFDQLGHRTAEVFFEVESVDVSMSPDSRR